MARLSTEGDPGVRDLNEAERRRRVERSSVREDREEFLRRPFEEVDGLDELSSPVPLSVDRGALNPRNGRFFMKREP